MVVYPNTPKRRMHMALVDLNAQIVNHKMPVQILAGQMSSRTYRLGLVGLQVGQVDSAQECAEVVLPHDESSLPSSSSASASFSSFLVNLNLNLNLNPNLILNQNQTTRMTPSFASSSSFSSFPSFPSFPSFRMPCSFRQATPSTSGSRFVPV